MSNVEFDEKGFTKKMQAPYFPIDKQPKIPTLNEPVILESAFPGWIPTALNPNILLKTDEVSKEIIASVNHCATTAIHVHPRDPKDGGLRVDAEVMKETLDPVFAEHRDIITWNHSWTGKPNELVDYKTHAFELLKLDGSPKCV
jgi:beta-keto acid cleavage enzyme